jgi:hypothetical protein
MKTFKYIFAIFIITFTYANTNAQNSEIRELAPFSKIDVNDNAKIYLHIGSPQSVVVETDKNPEGIKTKSENGTLSIRGASSTIRITIPELNGVDIGGFGTLIADTVISSKMLRLTISGNGKITMPVNTEQLQVGISGFGILNLQGKAESMELNISGNGKINGQELSVNKCEANISGIGKSFIDVKNELELNISGTGSFYYKNKPAIVETHISGIGKYGNYSGESSNDSGSVKNGNKKSIMIGKYDNYENFLGEFDCSDDTSFKAPAKSRSHWAGFEIGFNTLMAGNNFKTDLPSAYDFLELNSGKSINVNLNFFAHDFKLYKNYVMFTTGIGLTLNNYRFTSDRTLIADSNRVAASYDLDKAGNQITYQKNKLAVNYITMPLLLQFNTNERLNKSFHVATGILASYKYNSHLKLVYKDEGDKQKDKRQDEFNIDPFRFDATLRVGFRNYTLYASYALTELFKNNRGPELHPFQFGINVMGW